MTIIIIANLIFKLNYSLIIRFRYHKTIFILEKNKRRQKSTSPIIILKS